MVLGRFGTFESQAGRLELSLEIESHAIEPLVLVFFPFWLLWNALGIWT